MRKCVNAQDYPSFFTTKNMNPTEFYYNTHTTTSSEATTLYKRYIDMGHLNFAGKISAVQPLVIVISLGGFKHVRSTKGGPYILNPNRL